MFEVVTHCGVQVCSDEKFLGLLHCGVQVCSDDKCLEVVTLWGASVFR